MTITVSTKLESFALKIYCGTLINVRGTLINVRIPF